MTTHDDTTTTGAGAGDAATPTRLTGAQAATLVAAPAVAVVARLLSTPWLEEPSEYIGEVAADPGRSDTGALLTLLGALLFLPVALTLAGLLRSHRSRLSLAGGAMAVAGAVGMATAALAALIAGQMARSDDRDAMVELWDRIYSEPQTQAFPILLWVGSIGFVLLGIGLYNSRALPRPIAATVGLGGAATMATTCGPVRAAVTATAVIALVGFTWAVVNLQSGGRQHDPRRSPSHTVAART